MLCLCKNHSKTAHTLFMTKATDLKSPWKMDVETCVSLQYLFLKKILLIFFNLFLAFFQSLPSTKTIKVIDLFFQWTGLEKLGHEHMHFHPPRHYSRGGARDAPPRSPYIYSDPSVFIGLSIAEISIPTCSGSHWTPLPRRSKSTQIYTLYTSSFFREKTTDLYLYSLITI